MRKLRSIKEKWTAQVSAQSCWISNICSFYLYWFSDVNIFLLSLSSGIQFWSFYNLCNAYVYQVLNKSFMKGTWLPEYIRGIKKFIYLLFWLYIQPITRMFLWARCLTMIPFYSTLPTTITIFNNKENEPRCLMYPQKFYKKETSPNCREFFERVELISTYFSSQSWVYKE